MKESSKRTMLSLFIAGTVIGGMFVGTANAHIVTNVNHTWSHIKGKADRFYGQTWYTKAGPFSVGTGQVGFGEAVCPATSGALATGGGAFTSATNMSIEASYPTDGNGTGNSGFDFWGVYVRNDSGATATFTVYAVCQYSPFRNANFSEGSAPGRGPTSR